MRTSWRWAPALAVAAVSIIVAGCGSSKSSSSSAGQKTAGKTGGSVTVLEVGGGVDSLDPGYMYYQTDYRDLFQPTQRALYTFPPQDTTTPKPDLATALPTVSDGGKTMTIHIKTGVHYSAPLQTRTVAAADIKYALDRCYAASVGNGYSFIYFSNVVGAPAKPPTSVPSVSGITAPNATTLVIKTTRPIGVLATGQALALPCSTPVPPDYAAKYDKGATSSYGMHQVFTGPYMIQGAGTGTVPTSSYQTGKLLVLVRNPNWNRSQDPNRPAHFDQITYKGGFDITDASNQILNGHSLMSGDFAAPPVNILQQGLQTKKSQFVIKPSTGNRYITLNQTVPPLNNPNLRKAISAVLDKNALRLTRGGPAIGTPATHFIAPGTPGFQQSGGNAGPGDDFLSNPSGNLALATSYMKKAGYPSGKYTGPPLLTIADAAAPAKNTAEAIQSQLSTLGIKLTYREVPHATMLSKYCEVPKQKVAICPNLGWGPDFPDAQSMIDPIFNGKNIVPTGNTNMASVNNGALNQQMDAAEHVIDPTARATAWGALDKAVTSGAYVIPWLWDNEVNFASSNVNIATSPWNSNDADMNWSSLK